MPPVTDTSVTFAVQVFPDETPHEVAEDLLRLSKTVRVLFGQLDLIDIITLGGYSFVRCRADLEPATTFYEHLWAAGRGVVHLKGQNFVARMGSRQGLVPLTMMLSVPKPNPFGRTYQGSKVPFWERQFEPMN